MQATVIPRRSFSLRGGVESRGAKRVLRVVLWQLFARAVERKSFYRRAHARAATEKTVDGRRWQVLLERRMLRTKRINGWPTSQSPILMRHNYVKPIFVAMSA